MRREDVFAADELRDRAFCGRALGSAGPTRHGDTGAHDPTATPYFVLERLFPLVPFDSASHLLDVGCGTGRVLAHFAQAGIPGRATGVELDAGLAEATASWCAPYPQLDAHAGSVLDEPLAGYTHFYLFNPFDSAVLDAFVARLEAEVTRPVTLIHMSDNGEQWSYLGRPGWTVLHEGEFQDCIAPDSSTMRIYDFPQHFMIWRYEPAGAPGAAGRAE